MDFAQKMLYGSFPRDGATPTRFTLLGEGHFDHFVDWATNNRQNAYASLAQFKTVEGDDGYYAVAVNNKVTYDLDAEPEDVVGDMSETELISRMREDRDLAEAILGDVVDDMQTLVRASDEKDIPVLGVFSGFGVHVHQFYEETVDPKLEMRTTGAKFEDELGLETVDHRCFEPKRIMRIPNAQRYEDGNPLSLWTVPLTVDEMLSFDAHDLVCHSSQPREVMDPFVTNSAVRPSMDVHEDYIDQRTSSGNYGPKPVPDKNVDVGDDLEWLLEQFVPMPCIRERALGRDPDHPVRFYFAVMMFNIGFTPSEVHDYIRQLNWVDYDPKETETQLNQIYRRGYSDRPCETMMDENWCVREDNPQECRTYGWSDCECNWK